MVVVAIYKCLVNGGIDGPTRDAVTAGIVEVESQHFGTAADDVRVSFIEVGAGRWYTAGELSDASMVLGTVPPGTTQAVRSEVMSAIAHNFCAATGADFDHVMVVAADAKTSTPPPT